MKLRCGQSWEAKRAALMQWHLWFAWRPVRVGENDCRWLEIVERRRDYNYEFSFPWTWKYRVADVLLRDDGYGPDRNR